MDSPHPVGGQREGQLSPAGRLLLPEGQHPGPLRQPGGLYGEDHTQAVPEGTGAAQKGTAPPVRRLEDPAQQAEAQILKQKIIENAGSREPLHRKRSPSPFRGGFGALHHLKRLP